MSIIFSVTIIFFGDVTIEIYSKKLLSVIRLLRKPSVSREIR